MDAELPYIEAKGAGPSTARRSRSRPAAVPWPATL